VAHDVLRIGRDDDVATEQSRQLGEDRGLIQDGFSPATVVRYSSRRCPW
jgi:hypothetical protein